MNTHAKLEIALAAILCAMLLGCAPAPSKPVVGIGSPIPGAQVNVGQETQVLASAADSNGIARIELWVDGQLVTTSQSPSQQSAQAAILRWTPATAGPHFIEVQAINARNLLSEPARVTVNAVDAGSPTSGPTAAPATLPASTSVPPAACTNNAVFVQDVTVVDGTNWKSGQAFNKIWRVRNTGTCPWGSGYELAFVSGEAMTTQSSFVVPVTMPGATADLLVAMTAPAAAGTHTGQWRLRSSSSGPFGATMSVRINVLPAAQPQPLPPQPPQPPPQPVDNCPGAPVIASFSANPATITAGQSTTLNWGKVDNATNAAIDQGIGGVAAPGNTSVKPDKTTTYTLTATGCGGTATKQVTVTVDASALPTALLIPLVPVVPFRPDLAITDMRLVSTTGPSRLHVGIKNTANIDFDGTFNYKCVVPLVLLRGSNQQVAALGDEGTITRKIAKGGTGVFNPLGSMTFDATLYSYPQVICVISVDGDPTPGDNSMTITIP